MKPQFRILTIIVLSLFLASLGCSLPIHITNENETAAEEGSTGAEENEDWSEEGYWEEPDGSQQVTNPPADNSGLPDPVSTENVQPEDLTYLGAFRLPLEEDTGDTNGMGWLWSGSALTFYPDGDPGGSGDGYPGSLFGTGHDWYQMVSEISIPAPVISADHNLEDLPTAETLQPFADIRGGMYDYLNWELPRVGIQYLPAQPGQESGKLHFSWGEHMQPEENTGTHGWADLDLSNPNSQGIWFLGDYSIYRVNDYLFTVPPEWAEMYAPGMVLASGRYRDGGWAGMGPNIILYNPLMNGEMAAPHTHLDALAVLAYDDTSYGFEGAMMDEYNNADEWNGGAWLLTEDQHSAVIFVGTKGLGEDWYGFANGVVWPEEGPWPDIPDAPNDERGWWAEGFEPQIIFFDPDDLGKVARGEMQPWEPQPYAFLDISQYMYHLDPDYPKYRVGAIAYDRENSLLYVMELFADEDRPIVHVFRIE